MRVPDFALSMTCAGLLALVALPSLGPGPAFAQSASVEAELRRCRAIADRQARVDCYDTIVVPSAAAAVPAQSVAGAAVAPAPRAPAAGAAPAAPVPVAPAASVAAAPASSGPVAASAAAQQQEFGLLARPVSTLLQSIDSHIEGSFDGWVAGARLRLANGQVWEIVDGSSASYQLRDPKVRISRGLLGSFFMAIDGVSQSPRVRRIH